MISIRSRYQLYRDAHTVVSSAHTALENGAHLELFSDDAHVDMFTFEGESRAARDNVQSRNLSQRVGDLLSDSVGKVFVLWVRAHVGKRQYHDGIGYRAFRRRGCGRGGLCTYWCEEPIASFRDRLDDVWIAGVVVKGPAQLSDAAFQYVLSDDDVRPYGLKQLLLGQRFARVLGQAQQDFHYLGFEANGPAFARHAVEGRIDDPAPHFEALLHFAAFAAAHSDPGLTRFGCRESILSYSSSGVHVVVRQPLKSRR